MKKGLAIMRILISGSYFNIEEACMLRKIFILALVLMMSISSFAFADGETGNETWLDSEETEAIFTDVNQGDWFYEAVMTMNRYGIIEGYGDGTFKPLDSVLREEFAVMMVKALQLDIIETESSFTDVADGYWASKWIQTAKPYLTGFMKNGELIFKPSAVAVREDMAVALVRALDKPVDDSVLQALNGYEDTNDISNNLKNYVASAVKNNLMSGETIDGLNYIKPMDTLTRAEAAALLLSVVKEEKIVFDVEEKVVLDDGEFKLSITELDGGLELSWDYDTTENVSGYKIVASTEDGTPIYPENGYFKYTQDKKMIVYNNDAYNNGDFENFLPGADYYFAITAIVGETQISSNVIKASMPKAISIEGKVPEVTVSQAGEGILVEWSAIDTTGLQGYKVVASKYDTSPIYPENGYARWITEFNTHSYYIEPGTSYNGGDIGGYFKPGETYHISVTAVYNSGKIAGNTITYIMPGEPSEDLTTDRIPVVDVKAVDGKLVVEWSEISTIGLEGYKIVASKTNPFPKYSEDGYAYWITDLPTHMKEIYPNSTYNGGDLEGKFTSGEKYYISVTAVYSDEKVPGNAVYITMP